MIFIIIIAFLMIAFASYNVYSSNKLFKRRLQDKLVDRTAFKKNINYYIKKLYQSIVYYKDKHNLYFTSEFEQQRRSNILERFYFGTDRETNYKYYTAKNFVLSVITVLISIVINIILFKATQSKLVLRGLFAITLILLVFINILRYKNIERAITIENDILNRNFGDFYLVLYRILMNTKRKPLEKGLRANLIVSKNETMIRFINNALYLIDSEGEELAINRMINWYGNIHYLNRFLIIEQQIIRGADATTDLMGLRTEVLKEKEDLIEEKCYAIVRESNIIVWLAMFLTFQVSAGALAYVVQQSGIFK